MAMTDVADPAEHVPKMHHAFSKDFVRVSNAPPTATANNAATMGVAVPVDRVATMRRATIRGSVSLAVSPSVRGSNAATTDAEARAVNAVRKNTVAAKVFA